MFQTGDGSYTLSSLSFFLLLDDLKDSYKVLLVRAYENLFRPRPFWGGNSDLDI
jgi:hypothetical protein